MKLTRWYLGLVVSIVFLYMFQLIYNIFGHGVTSDAMNFAWVCPIPLFAFLIVNQVFQPTVLQSEAINYSFKSLLLATSSVVVGRILTGIFEIAGTNSGYLLFYYIAAVCFTGIGLFFYLLSIKEKHQVCNSK